MTRLTIQTNIKREVIDLTDQVVSRLPQGEGAVLVFVAHTTAAITTADLDPGTDLDLLDGLDGILPDISWRHPHDPSHTPDHILSSLVGPSVHIPYANGKLLLGTWQRIILIEFDGPRQRTIILSY